MTWFADRICEVSTTTGTGAFTLAGAVNASYRTFAQGFAAASTPYYAIVAIDANGNPTGQWECGYDSNFGAGTTLNRSVVLSNSSGNTSLIDFSSGTKQVTNVLPSAFLSPFTVLSGKVGIGTTSPLGLLSLYAAAADTLIEFGNSTSGAGGGFIGQLAGNDLFLINQTSSGDLYLGTNNTGRIIINSSGNVGIGTASADSTLTINGSLAKSSGTFFIDHPLDPLNKNLVHGFVEAPRYDLIYRGKVVLAAGTATVDIDLASNMTSGTFAALTQNAEVTSLCNQTGYMRVKPSAITEGVFTITCEDATSTDIIHWVVIAERADAFIKNNPLTRTDVNGKMIPEHDKPTHEATP